MRKSFFGKDGLSSVSANHISNMAKEIYRAIEAKYSSMTLYNTTIDTISGNNPKIIKEGMTVKELQQIPEDISKIYKLKALIAYLREAIKEKDAQIVSAQSYVDESLALLERPKEQIPMTTEDVMDTWTIGQQEHYLTLEAKCATLGQFVHEEGLLNQARNDFYKTKSNRISVSDGKNDTLVYVKNPTVENKDIDDIFFSLQKQHRELQAELNGMKATIQRTIDDDTREKAALYYKEVEEYNQKKSLLLAKQSIERKTRTKEASELKIVIPNNLKDIYNFVLETLNNKN